MTDYLSNVVAQSMGLMESVQPLIAPLFAAPSLSALDSMLQPIDFAPIAAPETLPAAATTSQVMLAALPTLVPLSSLDVAESSELAEPIFELSTESADQTKPPLGDFTDLDSNQTASIPVDGPVSSEESRVVGLDRQISAGEKDALTNDHRWAKPTPLLSPKARVVSSPPILSVPTPLSSSHEDFANVRKFVQSDDQGKALSYRVNSLTAREASPWHSQIEGSGVGADLSRPEVSWGNNDSVQRYPHPTLGRDQSTPSKRRDSQLKLLSSNIDSRTQYIDESQVIEKMFPFAPSKTEATGVIRPTPSFTIETNLEERDAHLAASPFSFPSSSHAHMPSMPDVTTFREALSMPTIEVAKEQDTQALKAVIQHQIDQRFIVERERKHQEVHIEQSAELIMPQFSKGDMQEPSRRHLQTNMERSMQAQDMQRQAERPLLQNENKAMEEQSAPIIRVSIGRVEVRASSPAAQLTEPQPSRPVPSLSLADYLNQRRGGLR
jgi:hypothetical protein